MCPNQGHEMHKCGSPPISNFSGVASSYIQTARPETRWSSLTLSSPLCFIAIYCPWDIIYPWTRKFFFYVAGEEGLRFGKNIWFLPKGCFLWWMHTTLSYKRWMRFVHVWNNTIWNSHKALIYAQNVKPGEFNKVKNSLRIAHLQGCNSKWTVHPVCPAVRRQCHPSCWRDLPTSLVWVIFKLWTWWITGKPGKHPSSGMGQPHSRVFQRRLSSSSTLKSPQWHFINW